MKTLKQISAMVVILLVVLITGAGTFPSVKEKDKKEPKTEAAVPEAEMQCGVTNAQITTYLQECSHHHTVLWVQDIPGTCDSRAGIEGCATATVYVSGGRIVGHIDVAGYCE